MVIIRRQVRSCLAIVFRSCEARLAMSTGIYRHARYSNQCATFSFDSSVAYTLAIRITLLACRDDRPMVESCEYYVG